MKNGFYSVLWRLLGPVVRLFLPIEVQGRENLPEGEAVMLCANHSSAWDPILLVLALWDNYPIRIMAKKQLFKIPLLGGILRMLGAFPVDRGNSDIGAVKNSIRSLKEGYSLMLFPEGTRVKEKGQVEVKSGAAMIAIRGGVKLVPVYVGMKKRLFCKTPIIFGLPFVPEYTGRNGTAEEYQLNAERVVDEAYRLGGVE